jgi:hypothetical protein
MKKIYTVIGLAILGLTSYNAGAQITLTTADMPSVGKIFQNNFDTLASSVNKLSPGGKGAAITWNYAALPISYEQADSIVLPSTTPYASQFGAANLADTTFGTPGYTYFNNSSSSFTAIGAEEYISTAGIMVGAVFTPSYLQLNFPGHYLDINGGTSRGIIPPINYVYLTIDSIKGTITVMYTDTTDSYGTLSTPFLSSVSTLRQKHSEVDIDSIWGYSTSVHAWGFLQAQKTKTYSYRWYANGLGDMAATMTMDSTNSKVKSFEWYAGKPNGINEVSQAHHTLVYPNPASTQVTFRFSAQNAQYISVYDLTGREITKAEMLNGTSVLNTSSFSNGLYLFRLLDKSGNVLDNGKFTIQQ